MAITLKPDILLKLKKAGYSTYRLRKEKIFGEATIQQIRTQTLCSWNTVDLLCDLLDCPIEEVVEHVKEEPEV